MLDILVTSSCRKTIIKTIDSFCKNIHYTGIFRFIIHIDVLKTRNLSLLQKYLRKTELSKNINIDVHVNYKPTGCFKKDLSVAVNYLFRKVSSPYFFYLEDDWVFLKNINLDPLIKCMEGHSNINHIRFCKSKIKHKCWLYHFPGEVFESNVDTMIDSIHLVKTPIWSFNPHLGRKSVVEAIGVVPADENPEQYICSAYWKKFGHNGIYIYGKIGDSPSVKDIGRNKLREKYWKIKYIISGGRYAKYRFP